MSERWHRAIRNTNHFSNAHSYTICAMMKMDSQAQSTVRQRGSGEDGPYPQPLCADSSHRRRVVIGRTTLAMRRVARITGVRIMLAMTLVLVSLTSLPWTPIVLASVTAVPDGDVAALIAAINSANANADADEIVLAANATYTLTAIDNGFNGLPAITSAITIRGNGATITRDTESPTFRLLAVRSTGILNLDNATISNGWSEFGGGIFINASGAVTLSNSIIGGNGANYGGGIYNGGTMTLTNNTISGNHADYGGGIYNDDTMTLTNNTISENVADTNGGGIYNDGTVTLTNSTINDNVAKSFLGGGIYSYYDGSVTLINSTISGNDAFFGGGGIFSMDRGTVTLTNSTVSGNWAFVDGGGISAEKVTVTVTNSTISGNEARSGGGIYYSGTLTVTNSTISGNSAHREGGGVYDYYYGTAILTNSTISGNHANIEGGGINNNNGYDGSVTLTNTIVAANTTDGNAPDVSGAVTSDSNHNLIGDGSSMSGVVDGDNGNQVGTAVAPIDPLLGDLANNRGLTETMLILDGSPAIDAVNDTSAPTTDQRGISRPQGVASDIGAVEIFGRRLGAPHLPHRQQHHWEHRLVHQRRDRLMVRHRFRVRHHQHRRLRRNGGHQ